MSKNILIIQPYRGNLKVDEVKKRIQLFQVDDKMLDLVQAFGTCHKFQIFEFRNKLVGNCRGSKLN